MDRVFLFAFLLLAVCGTVQAQPDIPSPIRVVHVVGYVMNSDGKPVPNVAVTLSQNDNVIYSTRTDQSGAFNFDHVSGKYLFRVARSDYAPAASEIVVRDELVTVLQRKKLYVILGPGACADACSSVLTSKQEYDHAIRKKSRH